MISPQQIRAGRALLDWTQLQLSERSGVSRASIKNIEKGITAPRMDSIEAITKAFEDSGLEFLPGNGVRERDQIVTVFEGEGTEERLLNDIYQTMLLEGGDEVLMSGLEEMNPETNPKEYALAKTHLDRLKNIGVKERILGKEGNNNYIAPWHWYRKLPKEGFVSIPLFIYGSKIALSTDTTPYKSIVINNSLFADSCRQLFNFVWERAKTPEMPPENIKDFDDV